MLEHIASYLSYFTIADGAIVILMLGQLLVSVRQSRISQSQAEISLENHNIAVAALGRPYVMFTGITHNYTDWRNGKEFMTFTFRLVNFGREPAVIKSIRAYAMLSYGPYSSIKDDANCIYEFPSKEQIQQPFIAPHGYRLPRVWSSSYEQAVGGNEPIILQQNQRSGVINSMLLSIH
jgi:hypothetical protein